MYQTNGDLTLSTIQMAQSAKGAIIAASLISLLFAILFIACLWRIYQKAGEPGWAAIVPIYNAYVLFKITWGNGLLFLLMLIPIANIAISFITIWKLVASFDGGIGTFLLILFLPVIGYPLLAFGGAEYMGAGGEILLH